MPKIESLVDAEVESLANVEIESLVNGNFKISWGTASQEFLSDGGLIGQRSSSDGFFAVNSIDLIAGVGIGAAALLMTIIGLFCCRRRCRKSSRPVGGSQIEPAPSKSR